MTQLNNLEGHEATQMVAQANSSTNATEEALINAYGFLFEACRIARLFKTPIRFAVIEIDKDFLTLGLGESYPNYFFQTDFHDATEEQYEKELDKVRLFCKDWKTREATKLYTEIAGLQAKLNKLEGRV